MTRYVVRLLNETMGLVVRVVSFDVTSGYSHSKGWEEKIQGHRQGQAQATYFTSGRAECPQDGAVLQIQEDSSGGIEDAGTAYSVSILRSTASLTGIAH